MQIKTIKLQKNGIILSDYAVFILDLLNIKTIAKNIIIM